MSWLPNCILPQHFGTRGQEVRNSAWIFWLLEEEEQGKQGGEVKYEPCAGESSAGTGVGCWNGKRMVQAEALNSL